MKKTKKTFLCVIMSVAMIFSLSVFVYGESGDFYKEIITEKSEVEELNNILHSDCENYEIIKIKNYEEIHKKVTAALNGEVIEGVHIWEDSSTTNGTYSTSADHEIGSYLYDEYNYIGCLALQGNHRDVYAVYAIYKCKSCSDTIAMFRENVGLTCRHY